MNPIKAIIVEDVPANHRHLADLLDKYCEEVKVMGAAENIADAVKLIRKTSPDLLFLDIELPDGSGFDLLSQLKPVSFRVIFVTGHQKYAYTAFRFHALDFLLKPISIRELKEAVQLALHGSVDDRYREALDGARQQYLDPDKIVLADANGFQVINAPEIIMMEAKGNYTDIYLSGNRKLTYCRILKEFATLLKDHKYIRRTHRSYVVNVNFIRSCSNDGIIKLEEDRIAFLGDSYRSDFLAFFRRS